MKTKLWFYGRGQSMADRGLPLEASPYWVARNTMPYFAWRAFTQGYEDATYWKEYITRVKQVVEEAKAEGQYVEINEMLPTVVVYRGKDDEFFFQEEQATELIEEHESTADKLKLDVEDLILYAAQEW